MIQFNEDVRKILEVLNSNGYEAYVVGGAVRNYLLGMTPHDYDITTNATPEEIIKVFSFTKTILTGIKYGTVTVVYNHQHYEITTYRVDGKYDDNRHPIDVEFSKTIDNDLKRRDFTVNALAYNEKLIDQHNGLNDLKNRIIKCIGNPDERFAEDALRILRAMRFACKLNFTIDLDTKKSILKNKNLLKNISIERINSELFEIFEYRNVNIIEEYFEVFTVVFPFIKLESKNQIINKINNLINNNCDKNLIYSAFFMELDDNYIIEIIKNYKLSNDLKYLIKFLNFAEISFSDQLNDYRKLLKKYTKNGIILYIKYHVFNNDKQIKFMNLLEEADKKCNKIKDLEINGNDLIELGVANEKIGFILNSVLDLVVEDFLENDKKTLIKYVKDIYL